MSCHVIYSYQQVRVEPPPSAVSMTLPAFAAERGAYCTTIAASLQQARHGGRSAANPPAAVAAVDRWDRQMDGRSFYSYE